MPRRRRLPRAAYPHAQERQYAAQLGALVERAWADGTERIARVYDREFSQRRDAVHVDARTIPGRLSIVVEGVSIVFGRLLDKQGELVPVSAGGATAEANAGAVVGQLGAVIAVDPIAAEPWLGPIMEAWRASNTALITGLGPDHAAAVNELVRRAWEEGRTTEWLQRELQRRLDVTTRRAELIARDQVGKLNGQLTMVRQSSYGISHYRWMSSMDERVRQLHAERHEVRFAWSDPPSDGHPGMPVQCRCVAEPDIDDVLADLEREGQEELVFGAPEIEALNRAIEELGQWQPDRELLKRLHNQAIEGVRAMVPKGGAPTERSRMPRPTVKQVRSTEKETRRAQPPTRAVAPPPVTDARPAVESRGRGTDPPAGMSVVPRGTVIDGEDGVPISEIDAITAEGFEEHKGSGSGFAGRHFDAKAEAKWHRKHLSSLDQRLRNISGVRSATRTRSSNESDSTTEFGSAQTIMATPRVMRLVMKGMSDDQLQRLNKALDVVRVNHPEWQIIVVGES